MKLYFFGGTFDPPHLAHEEIAKRCGKLCDKFIFFPCKASPLKDHSPIASEQHRINMTQLMANCLGGKYTVDDFEIKGNFPSYTIDTISYIKKTYSFTNLTMIVGADQMKNIDKWNDFESIDEALEIICFDRDNLAKNIKKCNFIKMDSDISSSKIRENFKIEKNKLNSLVFKYIVENHIYSN